MSPNSARPPTLLAAAAPAPLAVPADSAALRQRPSRGFRPRWTALAAFVLAAGAALAWWIAHPAATALDQFWAPVLRGTSPVMVCAAYVPVWSTPGVKPGGTPRLQDYIPLTDQFVGGGDLIATSRLSAMLTRLKRPYRVKVGNDVSFPDLRTGPAILVGYSYTRWREISAQMRYFIDGTRDPVGITDNGSPTAWDLPGLPADRHTSEDYAIVSRVFHPDTTPCWWNSPASPSTAPTPQATW